MSTTTTTRDRWDRYGPTEWAPQEGLAVVQNRRKRFGWVTPSLEYTQLYSSTDPFDICKNAAKSINIYVVTSKIFWGQRPPYYGDWLTRPSLTTHNNPPSPNYKSSAPAFNTVVPACDRQTARQVYIALGRSLGIAGS